MTLHLSTTYHLPSWQGGDKKIPRCQRSRFGWPGKALGGFALTTDRSVVTCSLCRSFPAELTPHLAEAAE
jgi:hypothetical protein